MASERRWHVDHCRSGLPGVQTFSGVKHGPHMEAELDHVPDMAILCHSCKANACRIKRQALICRFVSGAATVPNIVTQPSSRTIDTS